jgi:hypothetical protein
MAIGNITIYNKFLDSLKVIELLIDEFAATLLIGKSKWRSARKHLN